MAKSDAELIAEIRKLYGWVAEFFEIPELKAVFKTAIAGKWGPERLEGAITKTKWWKAHSEARRQWMALEKRDPAEARRRMGDRTLEVTAMWEQVGIASNPQRIREIAANSLRFGWSEIQLRRAIGAEFHYNPEAAALTGGTAALTLDGLRTQAEQWGVPLSEQTTKVWLESIVRGKSSEENFGIYLKEQAASLYPTLADAIDRGISPSQYFEPYRQIASGLLGVNPSEINFSDPKWAAALSVPSETGERAPMTLDAWQNEIRSNRKYGWQHTDQAVEQAHEMSLAINKMMGQVA